MSNAQQTLIPFTLSSLICLFGVWLQQPSIIGAGAGLAGGIGSARLAQSRQKDSKTLDMLQEMDNSRFKAMAKTLDTVIEAKNGQSEQIEELTNDSNDIKQMIEQLNQQLQMQKTQLNLQTRGIQKLQQQNRIDRASVVVAKDREIIDYQSEIKQLNNQVYQQEQNKLEPTTHFLVDGNAMKFVAQDLGKAISYHGLRNAATQGANKINSKIYLSDVGSNGQRNFITYLESHDFEVSLFPMINIGEGRMKVKGDDVALLIDATNVSFGDKVVLCIGGDADYVPVINRLRKMEIEFTIISYIKTTSKLLVEAAGSNLIDLQTIEY
jgi:uncharacterized LabA/DUF88 family protein